MWWGSGAPESWPTRRSSVPTRASTRGATKPKVTRSPSRANGEFTSLMHRQPRLAPLSALLLVGAALASADELASQYSPLAQIRVDNVAGLKVAWTHRTGEPLTPASGGGRPPAFEATAVYFADRLFVGTPNGKVIALEPETGKELWAFDAAIDRTGSYGDFANRGVAVWQDSKKDTRAVCARRIFYASIDARLFALDAATGAACL